MDKRYWMSWIGMVAALVVLTGIPGIAQPYTPADYYPLAVGNRWEYYVKFDINDPPEYDRRSAVEVVESRVFGTPGETTSYLVNYSEWTPGQPDTHVYRQVYHTYDVSGNFYISADIIGSDTVVYNPLAIWLRNPITVGDTISLSGGDIHVLREVLSVSDTLNLPLGGFSNCLRVREYMTVNGQPRHEEFYRAIPLTWAGGNWIAGDGRTSGTHWDSTGAREGFQYLISCDLAVGTEDAPVGLPRAFHLYQNYPNPFNPSTILPLALNRYARVTLTVYDELGRTVSHRWFELAPGWYALPIHGEDWSSGAYFVRVIANHQSQTAKMQLIK